MLELDKIYNMDCIEGMKQIDNESIDLVIIDPPYNIGKDNWDKIADYDNWIMKCFKECERILKDNGSFYWFHNDMQRIARIMEMLRVNTEFIFKQFIVWNKRFNKAKNKGFLDGFVETNQLRNYQKMAEYILFYTFQDETGTEKILPLALKPFREDMNEYLKKTKLNFNQIDLKLGWVRRKNKKQGTGLARHFFQGSGSYIFPTKNVFKQLDSIFHFDKSYEEYKQEYEDLRYTFNNQKTHHSVWNYEIENKSNEHITPKPLELIKNIILHSSKESNIVLDSFMGSGTTAIACKQLNRHFIGFEINSNYCKIANKRLEQEYIN